MFVAAVTAHREELFSTLAAPDAKNAVSTKTHYPSDLFAGPYAVAVLVLPALRSRCSRSRSAAVRGGGRAAAPLGVAEGLVGLQLPACPAVRRRSTAACRRLAPAWARRSCGRRLHSDLRPALLRRTIRGPWSEKRLFWDEGVSAGAPGLKKGWEGGEDVGLLAPGVRCGFGVGGLGPQSPSAGKRGSY